MGVATVLGPVIETLYWSGRRCITIDPCWILVSYISAFMPFQCAHRWSESQVLFTELMLVHLNDTAPFDESVRRKPPSVVS